jgi:hypothetical protein
VSVKLLAIPGSSCAKRRLVALNKLGKEDSGALEVAGVEVVVGGCHLALPGSFWSIGSSVVGPAGHGFSRAHVR